MNVNEKNVKPIKHLKKNLLEAKGLHRDVFEVVSLLSELIVRVVDTSL